MSFKHYLANYLAPHYKLTSVDTCWKIPNTLLNEVNLAMTTVKIEQIESAIAEAMAELNDREHIATGTWFPLFESLDELNEVYGNE